MSLFGAKGYDCSEGSRGCGDSNRRDGVPIVKGSVKGACRKGACSKGDAEMRAKIAVRMASIGIGAQGMP